MSPARGSSPIRVAIHTGAASPCWRSTSSAQAHSSRSGVIVISCYPSSPLAPRCAPALPICQPAPTARLQCLFGHQAAAEVAKRDRGGPLARTLTTATPILFPLVQLDQHEYPAAYRRAEEREHQDIGPRLLYPAVMGARSLRSDRRRFPAVATYRLGSNGGYEATTAEQDREATAYGNEALHGRRVQANFSRKAFATTATAGNP